MTFRRDSDGCYRISEWDCFPWLEHGFGTKHSVWPPPSQCATLKQVHSAEAHVADRTGCLGSGDALLSRQPGIYVSIRTADCVPLFLVDPVNRAIAAVHAGWRGTVSEIGPKTLKRMTETFSTRADQIEVAIGPSIGLCCYEVGPEVTEKLRSVFPEREDLSGKAKIDLAEANRRQLISFGVRPDAIALVPRCTACEPDDFHSYRRNTESAGRMISAIGIRK